MTGTHDIYLTGNYVIPEDDEGHNLRHEVYDSDEEDEDEEYDLSPDEDELELELDSDESDELDAIADPRVTEVDSEEEAAPKLVAKADKKGNNKRSADELDEEATLDAMLADSLKPEEPKLSKKQLKKLKKNNGEAAAAKTEDSKKDDAEKDSAAAKSDKKVQFAKNLEQGPTGSAEKAKAKSDTPAKVKAETPVKEKNENKGKEKNETKGKTTLGPKTVNGVLIDDKKLGSGPAAKKGDKVSMRYIGKLTDGKVFDGKFHGPSSHFPIC